MKTMNAANRDLRPAQKIGCMPVLTTFITTWLKPSIKEKKLRLTIPKVSIFLETIATIQKTFKN